MLRTMGEQWERIVAGRLLLLGKYIIAKPLPPPLRSIMVIKDPPLPTAF